MVHHARPPISIDGLSIRRYQPEDWNAVSHLYHNGLVRGQLDPDDTAADLDSIEETYFGVAGNYFWVAELGGDIIGTIGVLQDGPHVSQIRRIRADGAYQDTELVARLIETAVHYCWRHGALKVIFDTHIDPDRATRFVERLNLQYDRSRNAHGKVVLEFYVDLYHRPTQEAERDRTEPDEPREP